MTLFASDPNNEYEPTLARDLLALDAAGADLLTTNLTVYVDSTAGNDSSAGTQAAPFKTLARAFTERGNYVVRDCVFTIQLIGAGPFPITATIIGGWMHLGSGMTAIRGDNAVRIVHVTGTAAGDFVGSTPVINVSAGMGTDVHGGRFVRFLSGNLTGFVFQVAENTDTSLSMLDRAGRDQSGLPVAAGDTFEIFTPGTVLQCSGSNAFSNIAGGTSSPIAPALLLENVQVTGGFLSFHKSVVLPCAVKFSSGMSLQDASFYTGLADARPFGLSQYALRSTSCWFAGTFNSYGASYALFGAVFDGTFGVNDGSSVLVTKGFRFNAAVTVRYGALQVSVFSGSTGLWNATVNVISRGVLRTSYSSANGVARCTVTAGDVLRVKHGGLAIADHIVAWPGGTTGAGGYGVNVTDGGAFLCTSAPTWTGATAGKDLKTSNNAGVANSVLGATGTAAGTAADALLGETIARVTA